MAVWQPLTGFCEPAWKAGGTGSVPPCDFAAILVLVKNGIQDLVLVSTLLVVVVAVIAGMRLLTSGGNPAALKDAKSMMQKILTGYIVILSAWIIIYTIATTLLQPKFYYFLGN